MDKKLAVEKLSCFTKDVVGTGIKSAAMFNEWKKFNDGLMAEYFSYTQEESMPKIGSLVTACFHKELPLVMYNYSSVAHNTLYKFPQGWTDVLRLCRGIVFDYEGNLVALPFPKFFNYNEHQEMQVIPSGRYEATKKQDGHLGIIFEYDGKIHLTTRGFFDSPTALLAQPLIQQHALENGWKEKFDSDITLLTEIILPETKVYTNYDWQGFVIIGAFNRNTLEDYSYGKLVELSENLNFPVTKLWLSDDFDELLLLMKNSAITNEEGFVVRFANGLRMKLKFETYIGKMVADKLSYKYLMNRLLSGNLEKMLLTLPEEIQDTAYKMLGQILLAVTVPEAKQKWQRLYALVPAEESTSYYRGICRQFAKKISIS